MKNEATRLPSARGMRQYSLKKNLLYMAMALSRTKLLINRFLKETSLRYGVVPFLIAIAIYEFSYFQEYLAGHQQSGSPFTQILPISADQYYLYQTLFSPIVNVVDVFIFGGAVAAFARLLHVQRLSLVQVMVFFCSSEIPGRLWLWWSIISARFSSATIRLHGA